MANINLIVIKTDKLKQQAEFYSMLGLQFDYHNHSNGPYHYASVGGELVFEIYPLPKGVERPDTTTRLGFNVEDLNQVIQHLKLMDVVIVSEPSQTEWGYSAVVQDLDGRKIELTQK